ncbi:MAG: hypothetical protein RIT43_1679 [Bacteroidota bacterium]
MPEKHLHIVCLDVPFPADYGGAIDMFYRIKALKELGFKLTLHVFEYGRGKHQELEAFGAVHYYKRKRSIWHLFSGRPFIVQSRKNTLLLKRLLQDTSPILFEGIHTTWYLEHPDIRKRTTLVRMHNVEHEYYSGLGKQSSFLKNLFFQFEASKLKKYQSILSNCTAIVAIKEDEADQLRTLHSNVHVLPASLPDIEGRFIPTKRYALFHGNLSVPENQQAAVYLVQALSSLTDKEFSLVIAGKNPPKKLALLCKKAGASLLPNPSEKQLDQLVQEAHIHVLHTENASGIKLKLLSCLYSSGHLLVNPNMVKGTPLSDFCTIYEDSKDLKMHFLGLKNSALSKEDFEKRKLFIQTHFNNRKNCTLIQHLLSDEI